MNVFERASVSYLNFLDWQKDNRSFSSMAIFRAEDLLLTGTGEGERLRSYWISADFFPTLGVHPILGRVFRTEEDQIGGSPVAMIGEGLWERKFGRAPHIIGKTLTLNGKPYEVVGVVPASFSLYGRARDAYIPIGQWDDTTFRDRRASMGSQVIGRLKPGATIAKAQADMSNIANNLAAAYPNSNKGSGVTLVPLKQNIVGDIEPLLLVLLGAVAFVLLIACANVANLLLARSTGRAREFAIRIALGAGRGRVIRQLLTESMLLSVGGGALGLAFAFWGTQAVLRTLPQALPRASEIHLDTSVLLFTLGVSLGVGMLFGLAPALRLSEGNLPEVLKEGGRGASAARHRVQTLFVVAEIALALILLVGAGLMIRTLAALWNVHPGFNPHNMLTFSMTLPRNMAGDPDGQRALLRRVHDTLSAVPGVQFASLQAGSVPMQGDSEIPFWIEGRAKPATTQEMPYALFYLTESDHLKVMETPLLRGRFFTDQDRERSQPVAVIDDGFARKYFPNEDPIGKRLNLAIIDTQPVVIGIAGHVKHFGLDADATAKVQAQIYMPLMQIPDRFMPLLSSGIRIVSRIQGRSADVAGAIRPAMQQMSSEQIVYGIRTMDEVIAESLADRRFSMILLGVFAALAVLLSSIGIYGVISYIVEQRTHEIGIRMALGARRTDVLALVLGQGSRMALAGVGIGLLAAIGLTRMMNRMLFNVSATDPLTLGGVSLLLMIVALVACYLPARRAVRTDPVVALRRE
jgi:predicted permease